MRYLQIAFVLGALCLLTNASANAADHGQISGAALSQLGMGGMELLTDAQGLDVRGMGFAKATNVKQVVVVKASAKSSAKVFAASQAKVELSPASVIAIQNVNSPIFVNLGNNAN